MTASQPVLLACRAVLLWAGALACLPASAQAGAVTPLARLDRIDSVVVLSQAERLAADGSVKLVELPDSDEAAAGAAFVEATWRFDVETHAGRSGWALYLSGAQGHARIALNGMALSDTITEPLGPAPRGGDRLRLLDLPPHLLVDGINRVEITLRGKSVVSLSRISVGAQQALRDARDRKAAGMVYAPMVVASIIVCLGVSVLLIWLRRRGEPIYAYFGVAAIAWGLHTAWTVSPQAFLPQPHYAVWWTSLYAFVVAMLTAASLRFAGYQPLRVERALKWAVTLVPVALYISAALGVHGVVDSLVRLGMVAVAFCALVAVARSAWRQRNIESTLLVAMGVAAAGLGFRDWLVFQMADDNLPIQWAPFAGLPFVAMVGWFLIDRFVRATESLETLNRELESRVTTQGAQLVSALEAMRAARDSAESANRGKTSFLASASHDLRQPIHALGLYMGSLRQRPLEAGAREIVDRMDGSVVALDSLLNALLDISRIDAGALVPQPCAFDLAALVHRLADEFAPDAAARSLRFSARVASSGPVVVRSDPQLVERILRNLIANAIKYTAEGGVLVTCRSRAAAGSAAQWRIEVWDTGPGIAADEQARVFDEFYQSGNPQRDRRGGLGLGLSIVRRLAQLLKLPLMLYSRPGHGTRFVLDLPATSEPATVRARAPDHELRLDGLAVAVIEDDTEVRDAMCTLLQGWGCRVFDGVDADEVIRLSRADGQTPDAVVADLRLQGGLDGVGEIARLRAIFGADLPALLVSGDSAPERVRFLQRSGLPWLAKPTPAARLRSWLSQVVAAQTDQEQSA